MLRILITYRSMTLSGSQKCGHSNFLFDNLSGFAYFATNIMQKRHIYISGLILIGVIVLILLLSLLFKKKEKDTREIFQREIVANLKEGYSVKDTIFESLDNKNQQVVAIIHWEDKKNADQQDSLLIYELKGKELVKLFDTTDWNFDLGNGLNGDSIRVEDINGDNLKEFVVTRSQGGNCWTCASLMVFQVKEHRVTAFLNALPETQVIHGIRDLNGDIIKELIVLDAEWEEASGLCHACSPAIDLIFAWKNDRYQDESVEFPSYYDEKIEELEKEIREIIQDKSGIDYYIGRSMSVFFNYLKKGEKEEGWKVLNNYLAEENLKYFTAEEGYRYKIYLDLAKQILRNFHQRYFESGDSK